MVSRGTAERLLTVAQWLPLALMLAFPPHWAVQTLLLSLLSLNMLAEFRRISSHTRALLYESMNATAAGQLPDDLMNTPAFEPTYAAAPPPLAPLPGPATTGNGESAAQSSGLSTSTTAALKRNLSMTSLTNAKKEAETSPSKPPPAKQEPAKTPPKERALPSMRRFSLLGLVKRLLAAIPTGQPPRDEMPDVVLLIAGGHRISERM